MDISQKELYTMCANCKLHWMHFTLHGNTECMHSQIYKTGTYLFTS